MKRLALILAVILVASCDNSFRNVRIVGADVESLSPQGLRGLNATLNVTAYNPGKAFVVRDVNLVAKYRNSELVVFSCDSVAVDAGCTKSYSVSVNGSLAPGSSILTVLSLASDFDIKELDLDILGTVQAGRHRQKIKLRNIPAEKLIKRL